MWTKNYAKRMDEYNQKEPSLKWINMIWRSTFVIDNSVRDGYAPG